MGRCLRLKILQGAFWAFAQIRVCEFNAFTLYSAASRHAVHSVKCNTDWGKHVIEHTAVCPQLQSTLTFQSNTNRVSDDMRTMNETFLHSCHFTFTDVGIVLGKMRRVIKQTVTNSKLMQWSTRNTEKCTRIHETFRIILLNSTTTSRLPYHIILYIKHFETEHPVILHWSCLGEIRKTASKKSHGAELTTLFDQQFSLALLTDKSLQNTLRLPWVSNMWLRV